MLSSVSLSTESVGLLHARGLSGQQMTDFAELLDEAKEQLEEDTSAKQVLADMSSEDLELLRKATSLADPIRVDSLSNEGAINLFAEPDKTGMVDLNNDGIVEVGAARMITFPPVNAPAHVKEAWDEATEHLPERDKMFMQLHMHTLNFGVQIGDQPAKQALPPEEQWSTAGWQDLLSTARSALEFAVGREGWTPYRVLQQDVYNRFEEALGRADS